MSLSRALIAFTLLFSLQAFSAPSLDGTYTCNSPTGVHVITISTVGSQVYIQGLSPDLAQNGLACNNENFNFSQDGMALKGQNNCSDTQFGMEIYVENQSQGMAATATTQFTSNPDGTLTVTVGLHGTVDWQATNTDASLTCTR
jgi:hypothetical protein